MNLLLTDSVALKTWQFLIVWTTIIKFHGIWTTICLRYFLCDKADRLYQEEQERILSRLVPTELEWPSIGFQHSFQFDQKNIKVSRNDANRVVEVTICDLWFEICCSVYIAFMLENILELSCPSLSSALTTHTTERLSLPKSSTALDLKDEVSDFVQ